MRTITLKPDIAEQIEELADAMQTKAEDLVDKALRAYLEQVDLGSLAPASSHRYSFVSLGRTRHPRASVDAEDILEREIKPRDGWTVTS